MTRLRKYQGGTEFGQWLRRERAVKSRLGFIASDVDFVWRNYKTGLWMMLEEKRCYGAPRAGAWPTFPQATIFAILDGLARRDEHYRGFHLLQFEHTSPRDGAIWLDDRPVTEAELVKFLRFEDEELLSPVAADTWLPRALHREGGGERKR